MFVWCNSAVIVYMSQIGRGTLQFSIVGFGMAYCSVFVYGDCITTGKFCILSNFCLSEIDSRNSVEVERFAGLA